LRGMVPFRSVTSRNIGRTNQRMGPLLQSPDLVVASIKSNRAAAATLTDRRQRVVFIRLASWPPSAFRQLPRRLG
jgi:hypothetical protein